MPHMFFRRIYQIWTLVFSLALAAQEFNIDTETGEDIRKLELSL
jgi:hypothetical protein